jgi:hypothetical protein
MDREDEIELLKDEIGLLTTQLRGINIRLAQLEAAAEQDKRPTTERSARTAAATIIESSTGTAAASVIKKGDRVNIVNKLNKPSTWSPHVEWCQENAQRGTVTHFHKGQVHFITDNGVKTWRAINNLRKIEE